MALICNIEVYKHIFLSISKYTLNIDIRYVHSTTMTAASDWLTGSTDPNHSVTKTLLINLVF